MIIGLFSAKEIGEKKLEQIISKKLDSVNNMQIALARSGDIIVYPLDYSQLDFHFSQGALDLRVRNICPKPRSVCA